MLIAVFLVCYCLVLFIIVLGKRKRKFASTPILSGGLPILGNVNLLPKDSTHAWEIVSKVSKESLNRGDNILVTFGPVEIIVLTDPDDSATLLNSPAAEKGYVYDFAKPWIGNGLVTAPMSIWHNHRKMMYPMFSQQVLNGYMGVFNMQAKRLVLNLANEVSKGPFDHRRYLVLNGLETICQTALGIDLGDQNVSQNKKYIEAVDFLMNGFIKRFNSVWLHNNLLYDWSTLKRNQEKYIKIVHAMTNEAIANKKREFQQNSKSYSEEDASDNLQPLIDRILRVSEEKRITDEEIREQLDTVVLTGFDTSAHELIYALMLLGTYKDVQDLVYKEIQDVFGNSGRDVEKHDLPKLVFMEALLKESLRLYPVTPLVTRRNTTEIKLKNCTIPRNTNCVVSLYGINRHSVWGADAEQFRPERWLDPASLPTNPNAYATFGLGKRSCIGKTYAMMSMKTTLVHLLRHYRVSGDVTQLVLKMDPVLRPASGQHIQLELR